MTHVSLISDIKISADRQRREFNPDAIIELANSIEARGLLHAPVCRETANGLVLVAGERRLRAIESLYAMGGKFTHNGRIFAEPEIPYSTLGELSPLEAEEAELDENLKRQNLSWQEETAAIARLHKLRLAQAEISNQSHSVADTAREVFADETKDKSNAELGFYRDKVRTDLILANHLDNPEVSKAKTAKDALKILKKQEETSRNRELAERVGAKYSSASHTLVNEDCTTWLGKCSDSQFDVICTDPPYGMDADAFGDGGGKLENSEHHYKDDVGTWRDLMQRVVPELFRVAKPQAHAYIFCDLDRFHELKGLMETVGWYVFRTPLINYKPNSGRVPLPEHGPRRQYEICLYAIKGKKPVTAIFGDVITTTLEENLTHGAQKPVALYRNLLERSVRPGDRVLDCFAGTGTIFPAAHEMKIYATGIEMNPEYYGIAVKRLKALDNPD